MIREISPPSFMSQPLLSDQERSVFMNEAIDLFTHKRQGHFIHRMYMTPEALSYWGQFMKSRDYYITRNEIKIIKDYSHVIGDMAFHPDGIIGIENGPGTISAMKSKSAVFFSAMPGLKTYIGRDWSPTIAQNVPLVMKDALPAADVRAQLSNFLQDALPDDLDRGRKVIAEFGITNGNLEGFASDPFPAQRFLKDMTSQRSLLEKDDLYISTFDANQDEESIVNAYTSEWLTLWGRELFRSMVNQLPVSGDFDVGAFIFQPVWHADSHVNVNNMMALRDMEFSIGETVIKIHKHDLFAITNSYKIPVGLFSGIAGNAGFETIGLFQDRNKRMSMAVLKAV